jgi:methionyl-tRNA synthetase
LKIGGNFELAVEETGKQLEELLGNFKFNDALGAVWQLIASGNKYIDEKKPWAIDSGSDDFKETIGSLLYLISKIGILLKPFLPGTSDKIANAVKIKKSEILFPRLS